MMRKDRSNRAYNVHYSSAVEGISAVASSRSVRSGQVKFQRHGPTGLAIGYIAGTAM